ncbi:uncharacterized protein LOC136766441 isoform X2 [Amia ocellicauda]|uniref:uncharacterized protein LOC136766441 isoform X2 n=1 Tax=Amia ocellicauda TaxID=2972642 RepID=UPI003463E7A1
MDYNTHRGKYNRSFDKEQIVQESRKPIESYLMGKSLQNEIQKHYGPFSEEALEQSYDKVKGSGRAAVTSPQQRLIDDLLARRSIQQYDREERISQAHRQLKEERERLNRELRALRLQREHKEVIVLPHHHNDASALQARIQLRAERLPAMEAEVRNLRELLQKECLSESIIPVQPNSSKTVHQSVSEGVAELMDNELHVSPAIDPRSAQYPLVLCPFSLPPTVLLWSFQRKQPRHFITSIKCVKPYHLMLSLIPLRKLCQVNKLLGRATLMTSLQ